MSICDPCTAVTSIPECAEVLTIGTITDLNQAVIVYFKDHATGRTNTINTISDGSGLVTVDLSTVGWVMIDHPYEIYITKDDATSLSSKEVITIGAETPTCILLNFVAIKPLTITDYTLVVQ